MPTVNVLSYGTDSNTSMQVIVEMVAHEEPRGHLVMGKGAADLSLRACVYDARTGRYKELTSDAEIEARARSNNTSLRAIRDRGYAAQKTLVGAFNELMKQATGSSGSGGAVQMPFDFNVNRFLSDRMPMRIMTWRER